MELKDKSVAENQIKKSNNKNIQKTTDEHKQFIKKIEGKQNKSEQCHEKVSVLRGDLFYADLSPVIGSEQGGIRPVVIIQNDIGNKFSPTTIIAAITSVRNKSSMPTHVNVGKDIGGLPKDSVILLEQIRTIDKKRLREKIGRMTDAKMIEIDKALRISIHLLEG